MEDYRRKYKNKYDILNKGKQIIGKKFGDIKKEIKLNGHKSGAGDILEKWFGKTRDSKSEPDLGIVELKSTPFKENKNHTYSSKERLVLNMIDYYKIVQENFFNSHMYHKNKTLGIGFYKYIKDHKNDWQFNYFILYEMKNDKASLAIIKHDWQVIQQYVENGNADKLNEGLTDYLSACTKGRNHKSKTEQPYSDVPAKRRAFAFKSGFMTSILRNDVMGHRVNKGIIKNSDHDFDIVNKHGLRSLIKNRFDKYIGWSKTNLIKKFNVESKANSKGINNILAKAMLNVNDYNDNYNLDKTKEFQQAGFVLKTVQVNYKGEISEDMSFPTFKFSDLVSEHWFDEDGEPEAYLNRYLREHVFILFVFQYTDKNKVNDNDIFKGIKFFYVPDNDIDTKIKHVWQDTKNKLKDGIVLKGTKYGQNKIRIENNLIGQSDKLLMHVRPHASNSSYMNNNNSDKLPAKAHWINKPKDHKKYTDDYLTKQCFWFNKAYIKQQLKDLIKNRH